MTQGEEGFVALAARVRELEDSRAAAVNVLEDLDEERQRFALTQQATLNIFEDLSAERARLQDVQRATLNILEDFEGERSRLEGTQKATLNMLDDLSDEKAKTQAANRGLQQAVSAQTKAEREMRVKATELARSNDELQQFAYVASHDMQEPLRTVSGAMRRLSRRYQGRLDAEADEYIRFALEGTERMQRLIEDLLTYSRVGTRGVAPAEVDANAALRVALGSLRSAIEAAGATIEAADLPRVVADDSQLAQLFQNLVGNAIKFHGSAPPVVRITARREGAMVRFAVADNGIGIDPRFRERIFVIFQRLHTREAYPGTGIGLAVAKKIVERHGGTIEVESAVGAGSTFVFTLPAAAGGSP